METGRNKKLTDGKCDLCPEKAQIPWKKHKFCYRCWNDFWKIMRKELNNDQKRTKTRAEKNLSEIKKKERNGIRRPGKDYVNYDF